MSRNANCAIGDNWNRVKQRLRAELGDEVYSSWFGRVEPENLENGLLQLSVPTKFLQKWLQSHYASHVLDTCKAELEDVSALEFLVRSPSIRTRAGSSRASRKPSSARQAVSIDGVAGGFVESRGKNSSGRPARASGNGSMNQKAASSRANYRAGSPLVARQTFESFMVSASNRLAYAAAKQITENIFQFQPKYNPLFFHADVGRGKTHLLQAIAWELKQNAPKVRVIYLTAERFMMDFAEALRSQRALAFKEKLRNADVLLIDDIQFLNGESNHKEFDHIINTMIDSGRQVVVASAQAPARIKCLDPRMRSRLAGGLVTEIGPFDRDLRLRILQQRIEIEAQECPGFEVASEIVDLFADKLNGSGRELEGAITRLRASYQLTQHPATMKEAVEMVSSIAGNGESRRVRIEDILRTVSNQYSISRSDLLSSRRTRSIVRPRQIGMYLSKQLTSRSLPEIGRRFGGRDHTTVIHAIRKVEELMNEDPGLRDEIETLKQELHE